MLLGTDIRCNEEGTLSLEANPDGKDTIYTSQNEVPASEGCFSPFLPASGNAHVRKRRVHIMTILLCRMSQFLYLFYHVAERHLGNSVSERNKSQYRIDDVWEKPIVYPFLADDIQNSGGKQP